MTPDEAIAIVKSKANGHDVTEIQFALASAVLVDEIERLESLLVNAGQLLSDFLEAVLMKDLNYATKVAYEGYALLKNNQTSFYPKRRPIVLDESDDAVSRAMKPAFEKDRPEGSV